MPRDILVGARYYDFVLSDEFVVREIQPGDETEVLVEYDGEMGESIMKLDTLRNGEAIEVLSVPEE